MSTLNSHETLFTGAATTVAKTPACAAVNVLLGQSIAELGQLAKDTGQSAYCGQQLYDGLMQG